MSNTFWATFFGVAIAVLSVTVIQSVIDEWKLKRRRRDLRDLLDELEDFEADDED